MIAVDTSVLVYAHRAEVPQHAGAKRALTQLAQSRAAWCLPWPCVHEFIGVVTNLRLFKNPTPRQNALEQMQAWMASPSVSLLQETPRHWSLLRQLLEAGDITGARVHDARIAALCLQHGVRELWSSDRDFSRFPTLKVLNPLTI